MVAHRKSQSHKPRPAGDQLTVRRVSAKGESAAVYEFVPPRSVRERAADMAEVRAMLKAGETDVAIDELRWLLEDCHELLEAHMLLGRIAQDAGDLVLARGHFGRAYELGLDALPPGGLDSLLPYQRPPNQPFFQAGQGLVQCLLALGHQELAAGVTERLLALDPTDPLAVRTK